VSEENTSIPDLLRRFVAAPHSAEVAVGNIAVTLQTNDPGLVSAMLRAHDDDKGPYTSRLFMRLIRDDAAPSGALSQTFLSSWPLGTLALGPGTVIAIDCERREVIGFIADSVPADRVVKELIPTLFDFLLTGEASGRSQGGLARNSQKSDISEIET
jgi:hypothetical protein